MKCIYCDETIPDNSVWCPKCGAQQEEVKPDRAYSASSIPSPARSADEWQRGRSLKTILSVVFLAVSVPLLLLYAGLYLYNNQNEIGPLPSRAAFLTGEIVGVLFFALLISLVIFLIRKAIVRFRQRVPFLFCFSICLISVSFIWLIGQASLTVIKSFLSQNAAATASVATVPVVSQDGSFLVNVPRGWNTDDTCLSDTAQVRASKELEGLYLEIYTKPKADIGSDVTIEDYMKAVRQSMSEKVADPVWSDVSETTIDGHRALSTMLSGKLDKQNIIFTIYAVDGSSCFYQIYEWTPLSLAKRNLPILNNVTESLKEVS